MGKALGPCPLLNKCSPLKRGTKLPVSPTSYLCLLSTCGRGTCAPKVPRLCIDFHRGIFVLQESRDAPELQTSTNTLTMAWATGNVNGDFMAMDKDVECHHRLRHLHVAMSTTWTLPWRVIVRSHNRGRDQETARVAYPQPSCRRERVWKAWLRPGRRASTGLPL